MISLKILGIPQAQARPRVISRGGHTWTYSPKTDFYRLLYAEALAHRPQKPLDGPLHVIIRFYFPRPKNAPKDQIWKDTRGDADNFLKGVMDALTEAKWWHDDGQVANVTVMKFYGRIPGCQIQIEQLTPRTPLLNTVK